MKETLRIRLLLGASYYAGGVLALFYCFMISVTFSQLEGKVNLFACVISTCTLLLHMSSDETNWSPGHPSFLGTILVLSTTHLWINLCYIFAVLKKNILVLAMCSLILLLDICYYAYLFVYYVFDEELGQDRRAPVLLTLGAFAIVHLNGYMMGTLCIQHFRRQNQKAQAPKLPLIDDTASDADQYVLLVI